MGILNTEVSVMSPNRRVNLGLIAVFGLCVEAWIAVALFVAWVFATV